MSSAGRRNPRRESRAVDADDVGVRRTFVASHPRLDVEVVASPLAQKAHRLRIRRHDPCKPAQLCGHVGERGALVSREMRDGGTRELEYLADTAARLDCGNGEQV